MMFQWRTNQGAVDIPLIASFNQMTAIQIRRGSTQFV